MKALRNLRVRLALAFAGAVAAGVLVFSGVVVAVVAFDEESEEASAAGPENEEEGAVERVLFAMALASPVVIAGAVALGLMLARFALTPLREANDRIRQFTADAAHELKTPLTAIRGLAEVAVRRDRPAGDYRESLEEIHGEAVRLSGLVDALLTLARGDAGTLMPNPQVVDVVALAREAQLRFSAAPLAHDGQPACTRGDPVLLARVLDNLLENATLHGAPPIELSLRVEGAAVSVDVHDHGKGVPADVAPRVFERFARGDRSRQGQGLGLAIARAVATAHGGTLELVGAESGTRFRLTLPIAR
jgi:signal transduction histidine kinase